MADSNIRASAVVAAALLLGAERSFYSEPRAWPLHYPSAPKKRDAKKRGKRQTAKASRARNRRA